MNFQLEVVNIKMPLNTNYPLIIDIDLIHSYLCGYEFVQIGTLIALFHLCDWRINNSHIDKNKILIWTLREKKGLYTTMTKTYSSLDGAAIVQ